MNTGTQLCVCRWDFRHRVAIQSIFNLYSIYIQSISNLYIQSISHHVRYAPPTVAVIVVVVHAFRSPSSSERRKNLRPRTLQEQHRTHPPHTTFKTPNHTHNTPNAVGGNLKNRPTSPTKAEAAHDRHVNRAGLDGEPKKHGNGGKGTWGSPEDDIKEAERARAVEK